MSTLGRWPHIFPGRVAHPAIFWPGGAFRCVAQVSRPLPKIGCPIQASPPWRTRLRGVFVSTLHKFEFNLFRMASFVLAVRVSARSRSNKAPEHGCPRFGPHRP